MIKRYPEFPIDGVVLLDKPEGMSSNFALQRVKRHYQAIKAGHAGTLDPMATGMLPVCFGRATKISEYLLEADKCYRATIKLGSATDTGDRTGQVIETKAWIPACAGMTDYYHPDTDFTLPRHPDTAQQASGSSIHQLDSDERKLRCQNDVEKVLNQFTGEISQVPPMYSAVKHQGKALYKLARKGHEVERQARKVRIYQLDFISLNQDELTLDVKCSKGTYIRVLGEDIAKALGTVGHLTALRRLYSAGFENQPMQTLDVLNNADNKEQFLLPIESLLAGWQSFEISQEQLQTLLHGKPIKAFESEFSGKAKLLCQDKLAVIADMEQGRIVSRKFI